MKTGKIHKQAGNTHYLGQDGRANLSICGRWIENCREIEDVDEEIKQQVADENNQTEYHFALEMKLAEKVQKQLCKKCWGDMFSMQETVQ